MSYRHRQTDLSLSVKVIDRGAPLLNTNVQQDNVINDYKVSAKDHTALRNHMRIVFEEMSSWTPLIMYISRDVDNILDQICKKQTCPDFYYDGF